MSILPDDDQKVHEKSDSEFWRESYYINFFDTKSDLYGLAWQGVRPNAGFGETVFVLYDGMEALIKSIDMSVFVPADIGPERLISGKQHFECIVPWERWRATYEDEDTSFSVEWQQLSKICDWDWGDITEGSQHIQAAGRIQASGTVGGREIEFAGFGERDRSWGARNYKVMTYVWFNTIQFPDETAMHVMAMQSGEGNPFRLMGYLHKDGRTELLRQVRAEHVEYSSEWGPPVGGQLTYVDATGREVKVVEIQPLERIATVKGADSRSHVREPDGTETGNVSYLSFHRFLRDDGVLGRGMIDLVGARGIRPAKWEANEPVHSNLYDYGVFSEGKDDGHERG